MNVDTYFEIGSTHQVCEDYALAGTKEDMAYAILCDGCSSAKHTDVGARLIAHISEDIIKYLHRANLLKKDNIQEIFKSLLLKKISEISSVLGLDTIAFYSTLLIAITLESNYSVILGWGDGYYIIKYKPKEGTNTSLINIITTQFSSGAPYYIIYSSSLTRIDSYIEEFGSYPITKSFYSFDNNDTTGGECGTQEVSLDNSYTQLTWENDSTIQQIILSSDGLSSFKFDSKLNPQGLSEEISYFTLLPQLLDYKNPVGEFVKRKMGNSIKRAYKELGIVHYDDISFAVINK